MNPYCLFGTFQNIISETPLPVLIIIALVIAFIISHFEFKHFVRSVGRQLEREKFYKQRDTYFANIKNNLEK
jgi:hypothetical protein